MASAKPVIHGHDHRAAHADAIWATDPLFFDVANLGEWLDIETTGADGDGLGMHFVAAKPVTFTLSGSGSDGLFEVDADSVTLDAQGTTAQLLLHSNLDGFLTADRTLTLEGGVDNVAFAGVRVTASHGDLALLSTNGAVDIESATGTVTIQGVGVGISGGVEVVLSATSNFLIRDHLGAEIFRVDESDGSVHILTGTTIQADL